MFSVPSGDYRLKSDRREGHYNYIVCVTHGHKFYVCSGSIFRPKSSLLEASESTARNLIQIVYVTMQIRKTH